MDTVAQEYSQRSAPQHPKLIWKHANCSTAPHQPQ